MIPRTPPAQGLTEAEAERRLASSGPNEIIGRKRASALAAFLTRFKNPLVLILLAAAAISVSTGERASALIIVFIVLMSAFLDFLNTFKAEKAVQALQRRVMVTSTVIRDGRAREIPVAALVPGDLVSLKPGDLVPADGRLVRADDFFLNESSLTGESFPVERASGEDVFMGSSVETGEGWMETVSTGVATKFSAIAGGGIVMDINTGEVLSLVSLPDFNPNQEKKAFTKDQQNRMTSGVYELGSVIKAVTFAMAFDYDHRIRRDAVFLELCLDERQG